MPTSKKIAEHFRNPRRVGTLPKEDPDVGSGTAGSTEEGSLIHFQVRIDALELIVDTRFKAFGCPTTIAAASFLAESITGQKITQTELIKPEWIANELGVPETKRHCCDNALEALRAAISNALGKQI